MSSDCSEEPVVGTCLCDAAVEILSLSRVATAPPARDSIGLCLVIDAASLSSENGRDVYVETLFASIKKITVARLGHEKSCGFT